MKHGVQLKIVRHVFSLKMFDAIPNLAKEEDEYESSSNTEIFKNNTSGIK